MAGLMDLPNEIIYLILSYIIVCPIAAAAPSFSFLVPTRRPDEPNICIFQLRQVNHRFNSHISRLFFENITIPYEAYSSFPTFLKSAIFSPENENVGYIKRLSIKPFILDSESRCRYLNSLGSLVKDLDVAREEFKADMKKDIAGLIGRLRPNQLVGFECAIHGLVDYQALIDTQRSLQQLLVNPVELVPHILDNPNFFLPCLQNLHLEGFRPSHETQYQLLARTIIQPYASKLRVLSIDMTEDTRDGSPSTYHSEAILETCKSRLKATLGADILDPQVIPLEFTQLEELSIQGSHNSHPIPVFEGLLPITSLGRLTIKNCTQLNDVYRLLPTAFPRINHLHIEGSLTMRRVTRILEHFPRLSHFHLSHIPKSSADSSFFNRLALWHHRCSLQSIWLGAGHISSQKVITRNTRPRRLHVNDIGRHLRRFVEIAVEVRLDELFLGNNIPNWPRLPNLELLRVLGSDTEPESESDTPPEPPMHPSDAIKILWTQRLEQTFCKITNFPGEFWLIHGMYKKPVYSGPTGPRVEIFKSWIGEGGEVVIKEMSFRDARRRFPRSLILGTERDQAMWEGPVRG
ncbi:hypothetical protein AOL_s00169g165 [Orbilia oligospora ATCC 24927]|uniref:Uncharacterized protein n=1 Tax=Arthrobotrys oligospora (strain ATCC 24927 / CBS 115.81 / DSM 1491) TaxID=756982 RepID=G1XMW2_ARTOA|nr:hypothetical protein AOL_s00169g165 [Orbilia oligospora ATCC 24927]EGX45559.1 hypothetical protein AOL_s00169g165 [Orbilia oligospora ATCC 24927]